MTGSTERIYWLDTCAAALPRSEGALPKRVDVAVVGAGYTGITTALHLARAGRSVAVFDAVAIGHGASSRNGGLVGPGLHKLGITGLTRQYGETQAAAILREGLHALDHFEEMVRTEDLDCDFQLRGRFRGARTRAHYEASARECDWLRRHVGLPTDMVPQSDQRAEIGSDFYRGGVVYHRDGGVHPRKLVVALARRAAEAGVVFFAPCAVSGLRREGGRVTLRTVRGTLEAAQVVMATNGYADRRTMAMHRRVVPIRTSAAACGPLDADVMAELSPKARVHGESGRVFMWYRPTPDGRSFIFGGRFGGQGAAPAARLAAIRGSALRVFPQLADAPFSHVWSGYVAYTPDHSPHLGHEDGVWLAGGYCGSGVTRSIYFAAKLASRILGEPEAETAFDALPFRPVPFKPFSGLGAAMLTRWYAMQDSHDLKDRDTPDAT